MCGLLKDISDPETANIKASQSGDHDAYRRLIEQHEASISRLMWRFSQEVSVCEELVHETFVEAYTSLGKYQFQGPFSAWLKRIATRTGYRFWKKQHQARKLTRLDEIGPIEIPRTHQPEYDPEVLANYLLSQLKLTERLVLTLLYYDNCSIKEIAERLGWTHAMVKMRAYRARQKLKAIVKREKLLDAMESKVAEYKLQQISLPETGVRIEIPAG